MTAEIKDQDVMIDIETMGQGSNAAVVAIGAVFFDKGGLRHEFYEKIDLREAAKYGDIDPDTILWWLKQSDDARSELTSKETRDINTVMYQLNSFITSGGVGVRIWGNGADFDNVILDNLFKKMDILTPWKFWNNRCYRTMKNMFSGVNMKREGIHHNALDDAKSQALHLIEIVNVLNIELK